MLIVCTRDTAIRESTRNSQSGSGNWSDVYLIPANFNRKEATESMSMCLKALKKNEPLCFSAHGNDYEIGDAGSGKEDWGWTPEQIAELLKKNAPENYSNPILIHACAEEVSNFSTRLVISLEEKKALNKVWIFGYNVAIGYNEPYPAIANLFKKDEKLQWAQVVY